MKCFYHKSDLDGHCSGAIVKMKYPECEMIGVEYDSNIEDYEITIGEEIYIVDFSFDSVIMGNLHKMINLHWIDHHKSAIEKCSNLTNIKGIREIGKAGCELTWNYLYSDCEMPEAVRLLGRYDVWDHENENVLPFQYGMRQIKDTTPESSIWCQFVNPFWPSDLTSESIQGRIKTGKTILLYQSRQDEIYAKGMSFETTFEGLRAIAINKSFCNSKLFDSVYDSEKHDIMIAFGVRDGNWKYSVYSAKDGVDCSEIAIRFGGGGHKGAAGFYSDEYVL